MKRTFSRDR